MIGRHDGNSATHITSTIDPRDRPFILGTTAKGNHGALSTLDEAFKSSSPSAFPEFVNTSKGMNVSAALEIAQKLEPSFYWNCESTRSAEGWYAYKGGSAATIARALVVAPFVDVSWACMGTYDPRQATEYAKAIQSAYPGKWMAYNFTGAFGPNGEQESQYSDTNG